MSFFYCCRSVPWNFQSNHCTDVAFDACLFVLYTFLYNWGKKARCKASDEKTKYRRNDKKYLSTECEREIAHLNRQTYTHPTYSLLTLWFTRCAYFWIHWRIQLAFCVYANVLSIWRRRSSLWVEKCFNYLETRKFINKSRAFLVPYLFVFTYSWFWLPCVTLNICAAIQKRVLMYTYNSIS